MTCGYCRLEGHRIRDCARLSPHERAEMLARAAARKAARRLAFAGVYAGAYLRGDRRNAFLVHVVELSGSGVPVRALCGRVKPENLCEDPFAPGAAGPATCPTCLKRAKGADVRPMPK